MCLPQSWSWKQETPHTLAATVLFSCGEQLDAIDATWASRDESVASIEAQAGRVTVTALAPGSTEIEVNWLELTAAARVEVIAGSDGGVPEDPISDAGQN